MPEEDRRGAILLKEHFLQVREVDEKLRTEEIRRVDASVLALKELTAERFSSSDKAIGKAEKAQSDYNVAHNDLARKMDEQNKATMPRTEIEVRFAAIEEKTALLTGSFKSGSGAAQGVKDTKEDIKATIAMVTAAISVVVAGVAVFLGK